MIATLLVGAALVTMALASGRLLLGPTQADRVIALDLVLAANIALAVAAAVSTERPLFMDVAIGLAMVGFVGTVAWARIIERVKGGDEP
jgi:multicomponent Na+:H+ antiporter subunit F